MIIFPKAVVVKNMGLKTDNSSEKYLFWGALTEILQKFTGMATRRAAASGVAAALSQAMV